MRRTQIVLVVFFSVFSAVILRAGETVKPLAVQQCCRDLWFIDTHGVSWTHGSERDFQNIAYYRLEGRCWIRSDAETFFQTQNPDIPLFVFSPGYTSTTESTLDVGTQILRLCDPNKPLRMVFWNWPAEREVIRLRRDIRAKIPIAATNALYLSKFLKKLQPESKVCVLGFSFGTRLVVDAVELLGDCKPPGMCLHLVLAGAAADQCGMACNGRNRNVPRIADKILILYNPADIRLRFYPLMYDYRYNPQALGRYGPPMPYISQEFWHKFESVNINGYVGIRHITMIQLNTPAFRSRIDKYLFFEPDYTMTQGSIPNPN